MNEKIGNQKRFSSRRLLLLCAIGALPGAMCVHSADAQPASNTAPTNAAAMAGAQSSPAGQPRASQPLNWGALNPQPLPPGPPDPSHSFANPANAMGQHGIIIVGGQPTPGSGSAPAAAPLSVPSALGMQTQTSQQPMTQSPANALSNRQGVLGTVRARGKSTGVASLPRARKMKFAPQRASLLSQQAAARDAENAIASSIRMYMTNGFAPRRAGVSDSIATAGAIGQLTASQGPARINAVGQNALHIPSGMQLASAQGPARIKAVGQNALHVPPGIWFVNNKESGFLLTPGGYVTIQGKAFGAEVGKVQLLGHTSAGTLSLQVIDWHDDEVYALLPAGISGIPDQLATLQLTTRLGITYAIDNVTFRAARAEITLMSHLDQLVALISGPSWSTYNIRSDGFVGRSTVGGSLDCNAPGTDQLYFKPPAGWEVSGVQASFGRADSGDGDGFGHDGSRVFTPGYDLGDWARSSQPGTAPWMLPVQWGVWRSHRSPTVGPADYIPAQVVDIASYVVQIPGGTGGEDLCESDYQIFVQLIGPAGLSPY